MGLLDKIRNFYFTDLFLEYKGLDPEIERKIDSYKNYLDTNSESSNDDYSSQD